MITGYNRHNDLRIKKLNSNLAHTNCMNLDAYRKRKDRFLKAKQFITGHESAVFSKLLEIINKSGNQELIFGSYHLRYTFSEIREEGKTDLAVIEDIPNESADLASMSIYLIIQSVLDSTIR
jgi:hypothetical protein